MREPQSKDRREANLLLKILDRLLSLRPRPLESWVYIVELVVMTFMVSLLIMHDRESVHSLLQKFWGTQ